MEAMIDDDGGGDPAGRDGAGGAHGASTGPGRGAAR